jgi:hypothetical protein
MPGVAAARASDRAPRRSVQLLFVDEVAGPASRAGEYHRCLRLYRLSPDPPRRASSRKWWSASPNIVSIIVVRLK